MIQDRCKLSALVVAALLSIACSTMSQAKAAEAMPNAGTQVQASRRSYSASPSASPSPSRSWSHGRLASALNSLTNLSSLQHITATYGSSSAGDAGAKQEIPIYEVQHEGDSGTAHGHHHQHHHQHVDDGHSGESALRSAIYNLHAAGAHNGFLPSLGYGKFSSPPPLEAATHSLPQTPAHDKISDGNFMHHYAHNSGYGEQQQQQQQQQQLQQYFSAHSGAASGPFEQYHQSSAPSGTYDNYANYDTYPGDNYLGAQHESGADDAPAEADDATGYGWSGHGHGFGNGYGNGHGHGHGHGSSQPDVISYVPYPVVKKVHVPVHEPVNIPVSHAVVVPVSKPVPIHIPVPKQVQVPVEKELKIPIERVVPYPVEKNVPVPIEKRVPFPVVKYVPIKVPKPFPVKVPVFKTILHKVKSSW